MQAKMKSNGMCASGDINLGSVHLSHGGINRDVIAIQFIAIIDFSVDISIISII